MAEESDNHRRILNGSDDLQCATTIRAAVDVNIEDPFEQPGPAHARWRALRVSVIG